MPTTYTEADLIAVRTTIMRGEKTVQFRDRSVTYQDLGDLLKVEERILSELNTVTTTRRRRQYFGVASKGLD